MIDNIKVIVMNEEVTVKKGITLLEISKKYQDRFKYPIVVAKVNGTIKELSEEIEKPVNIDFLDYTDPDANRIYLNGLIFLTIYAGLELWGINTKIKVQHSIDRGIYIETSINLTEEKLEQLDQKMKEIIKNNEPIIKITTPRSEAIAYYEAIGDDSKVGLMKYMTNTFVTLYRLGNYYDYMFTKMPVETKALSEYKLTYLNKHGFVLRYLSIYSNKIEEYRHHEMLFNAFKENIEWGKLMKIETASDLNEIVSKGKSDELIRINETLQNNKLLEIAEEIYNHKKVKVVLIAGPSCSGKTTTCRKLAMYLRSFGLNPKELSLDNYFKERVDTPKHENGEYDFECLEALDLNLFNKQIEALLNNEKIVIPTFNFITGKKEFKDELHLEEKDILIIEGIHALNDKLLKNIPDEEKYKIYLSALAELNIDYHNRVSTTDNRLLRRIVRDNRTRGYTVNDTLSRWRSVRLGEEKYIFTNQDNANIVVDTALIYEIGVIKTYVLPLLYSVDITSPYYDEAKRLIDYLSAFLPIPSESIPEDSILREFIGGSCFE